MSIQTRSGNHFFFKVRVETLVIDTLTAQMQARQVCVCVCVSLCVFVCECLYTLYYVLIQGMCEASNASLLHLILTSKMYLILPQ